jgi:succinoglycan biosynthesis transport protein ExoP
MREVNTKVKKADVGGIGRGPALDGAYQRPFMDIRELLNSLWRERLVIGAALALALALAAVYLFITPRTYTATAQLLMDLNRPLTGDAQALGADTTRFMMGPVIDSQVEIIRANRVVKRVIAKTGYAVSDDATVAAPAAPEAVNPETKPQEDATPEAAPDGNAAVAAEPKAGEANTFDRDKIPLAAVGRFQKNLDVRRKGLTLILLVQFTDRDPERAALIANTVVDEYLADRERMEQAASRRAITTLNVRIEQARADIDRGEELLRKLSTEHNLVSAGGATLDERQILDTATQLNLARTEESRLLADLRQWEMQSKNSSGIATISKLTDARHNYEVTRAQVQILERTLSDLKENFASKSKALNEYIELQKENQAARDNYLAMVTRVKQLETEQNSSMLDIQLFDNAVAPQSPSSPNLPLVILAGLLGGLGLGVTTAVIKDHISTVLRTPQLVQSNLGVPNITSLQQLRGRNVDPFSTLANQPNLPFVQGILTIHRFLSEARSGSQRVIAIVSASDGDGKSTIASALAQYAASITHQRTALIDCDIHHRTLSKRFAPDAPHSFAQAVNGTVSPANVMTEPAGCAFSLCTAPWEDNKLSSLETLMSPAMPKFIKASSRDFDLVILDTPAMLNNVETRALVGMADIVILIVDARSTTVESIASAKEMVPELESRLSGVVLNHVV